MSKRVCNFVNAHKGMVTGAAVSAATALAPVASFAAVEGGNGYIQADWVANLLPNITADVGTMIPIGIGVMSIFIGISLIPKIIYKFLG